MNRILFAFHRRMGLCAGIFLLLIGLSGSILVFHHSLERWLNPALYQIEPQGNRLSLDSLFNIVYNKYGGSNASCSVDMPQTVAEIWEFTLTKPQMNYHARELRIVDLHPYTGAILREGNEMSTSFMHW